MSIGSGNVYNPETGEWELPDYQKMNQQVQRLGRRVKELEIADRYFAIMDEINCDFEDMFPDWRKE